MDVVKMAVHVHGGGKHFLRIVKTWQGAAEWTEHLIPFHRITSINATASEIFVMADTQHLRVDCEDAPTRAQAMHDVAYAWSRYLDSQALQQTDKLR